MTKNKRCLFSGFRFPCYRFRAGSRFMQPHGLQPARCTCPSPSPGACSNSCPQTRWCHPTVSSFAVLFSSCPQSFPASWSGWLFASGGQSVGPSASASVLPMNPGLISFRTDWVHRISAASELKPIFLSSHIFEAPNLQFSSQALGTQNETNKKSTDIAG